MSGEESSVDSLSDENLDVLTPLPDRFRRTSSLSIDLDSLGYAGPRRITDSFEGATTSSDIEFISPPPEIASRFFPLPSSTDPTDSEVLTPSPVSSEDSDAESTMSTTPTKPSPTPPTTKAPPTPPPAPPTTTTGSTSGATGGSTGGTAAGVTGGAGLLAGPPFRGPRLPPPPPAIQTAGGFAINKLPGINTVIGGTHVHGKGERAALSAHERTLLYEQFVSKMSNGAKFTTLPMNINDPKQLSTFSSVDSIIQSIMERLESFDCRDVFHVVHVTDMYNGTVEMEDVPGAAAVAGAIPRQTKMTDLLTEYSHVPISTVALSNQFYHRWTEDRVNQFHTNLKWSYQLLKNNIDPVLMTHLQSKYDAFDANQRGGPLLFALLMSELLYTNESAVHSLKEQIEKYKINKVPGEDIKKISAIILAVSKRIWFSRSLSFPESFVDTIISLLQTSSVPAFNEQYKNIALKRAADKAQDRVAATSGAPAVPHTYANDLQTVEQLFNMASTFYDGYSRDGTWATHVKSKSASTQAAPSHSEIKPSALVTGTCFNCGSKSHMLPDCPQPVNDSRIQANKTKYLAAKKAAKARKHSSDGTSTSTGQATTNGDTRSSSSTAAQGSPGQRSDSKWGPPDSNGPKQKFIWTRSLGSQPYKYNESTRRWDLMVPVPSSNNSANSRTSVASTTSSQQNSDSKPGAHAPMSSGDDTAALRAQLAEMRCQLELLNEQV